MKGQNISTTTFLEIHSKHLSGKSLRELSDEYSMPFNTIYYGFKRLKLEVRKATNDQRRYKAVIQDDWFDNVDCQEKAYFLGLLMADGYVYSPGGNKSPRVCLKLHKEDRYLVETFVSLVAPGHTLYPDQNSFGCQIPSFKLVQALSEYGLYERKTVVGKTFPVLSDDLRFHFIRGFFDGDGSIHLAERNKSTIYICAVDSSFLEDVKTFLDIHQISNTIYKEDRDSYRAMYKLGINSRVKFYQKMYKNASIFMIRKKLKYDHVNTVLTAKASGNVERRS
jgi:hypothetical protein